MTKFQHWLIKPLMPNWGNEKLANLIQKPSEDLTLTERWIHYKLAEAEAKKELEKIKAEALAEVERNGGFVTGSNGKAQLVNKTDRRPKESLKTFLAEKGVLELCIKDDIDLKKVQEMIDAGVLDADEVEKHIETKLNSYLKLGK